MRATLLAWGSDPLEPPGRRCRLAGKPAGPIARTGLGERPPWNPPGRRWRLAGKPAGPIARASPGEHSAFPGKPPDPMARNPRWPKRPRDFVAWPLALVAWGYRLLAVSRRGLPRGLVRRAPRYRGSRAGTPGSGGRRTPRPSPGR